MLPTTLVLALLCAHAADSRGADLTGTVLGSEGRPLPGAIVYIYTGKERNGEATRCPSCYSDCTKQAITGTAGTFAIRDLDQTLLFQVLVVADGHAPALVDDVDPVIGTLRVRLKPTNPFQLPERHLLRGRVLSPQSRDHCLSEVKHWVFSRSMFRTRFPDAGELFYPSPFGGWRVRKREAGSDIARPDVVYHLDQLLATCAELGVPLTQTIETAIGTITLSELVKSSRSEFVADQECYWSVVAYASYFPLETEWRNRFGDQHSYQEIAQKLLEMDLDREPCVGAHKHYVLACLLQLDQEFGVLGRSLRRDVETHLVRASRSLVNSQLPNGGWHRGWAKDAMLADEIRSEWLGIDRLVQVTGHHLEWLCLVPNQLGPGDEVISSAARLVLKALNSHSTEGLLANYCAFSHGLRALVMLKRSTSSSGLAYRAPGLSH